MIVNDLLALRFHIHVAFVDFWLWEAALPLCIDSAYE
jgi:hypothetical protein